jgi:hypothetical protein
MDGVRDTIVRRLWRLLARRGVTGTETVCPRGAASDDAHPLTGEVGTPGKTAFKTVAIVFRRSMR